MGLISYTGGIPVTFTLFTYCSSRLPWQPHTQETQANLESIRWSYSKYCTLKQRRKPNPGVLKLRQARSGATPFIISYHDI